MSGGFATYIPVLNWLSRYKKEWLRPDIVAGLTVAAVVVPQTMAYAVIAGLPVEAGLYTALGAMLVYPILGSSRPLSVTTTSAIAMLTAAQIAASSQASGFNATTVAATLAVLVGGILINANQELLAVGVANVASSLFSGLPSGGGTSQTAVADSSGARSQMAQWVNVVAVLIALLFLSRVISLLPKAALGALILVTAISMIKPETFRVIARIRRMELVWSLITLAGVILIGTLQGILIAVAISILTLFYQANHPPVYAVAYNREKAIFRREDENESDETFPGLLMLRTEGRLTFANAENASEKIKALVAQTEPRVIVLECSAIPDIEYTALVMLTDAEQNMRTRGVSLWLAAVNPDLLKVIERSPLGAALGHDRMFFNLHKALEAWQRGEQPKPIEKGE